MKSIILFLLLIVLISSCAKDDDYILSQSVFVEDPYNPRLPIYSEWGYNTFGAYIDRVPFISSNDVVPAKVFVNNDTIHFLLQGYKNYNRVNIKFSFKGYSPQTEYELIMLNDVLINLKDYGRFVTLKIDNTEYNLNIIEGELHFIKAQKLYVDNVLYKTILCGTFRLKTFLNNEPISIYSGRFDVGIGYENFFNF